MGLIVHIQAANGLASEVWGCCIGGYAVYLALGEAEFGIKVQYA
jgi:hypothetical protein